jgi:hypothetical protein
MTTSTALVLVSALCRGETLDVAARSAGVGLSTVYRWMALANKGDLRFVALVEAVKQSKAVAETARAYNEANRWMDSFESLCRM